MPVSTELVGVQAFGTLDAVAPMLALGEGSSVKWVTVRVAAWKGEAEPLDGDASSGCEDVPLGSDS